MQRYSSISFQPRFASIFYVLLSAKCPIGIIFSRKFWQYLFF